jgi:trk system potassium uptake protein TrkH
LPAAAPGGGIKIIRLILILKQGNLEIKRLIHPHAVIPIKVNGQPVSDRVMEAVWGFFSVYILMFALLFVSVLATGLDPLTAFSAVAACINNLGPGLGQVALHYGDINQIAKWILCFAMLIGRLEIFTLLVLFSPMFWQK